MGLSVCLLLEKSSEVLAAVNDPKDFHAVLGWTVNYYVTGSGHDETPVVFSESGTGYSKVGIIRKQIKSL